MTGPAGTCPRCGVSVTAGAAAPSTSPFCSPRCKLVDLAKWLSGSYRIPGEPVGELTSGPGARLSDEADDESSMPSA